MSKADYFQFRNIKIKELLGRVVPHIILGIFQIYLYPYTVDDAFITLRFARNLAYSGEFVYNLGGARVEGYSNFLLVLILVPIYWMGSDPVFFVKFLGILCGHATLIVLNQATKWHYPDSTYHLIPPLFLSLIPSFALHSISGMETALYILLISILTLFLSENLLSSQRWRVAESVVLIAIGLTRIDGLVVVGIYLLYELLLCIRGHNLRKFLDFIPSIILLGVYNLWRFLYYGEILPSTSRLKSPDLLFISTDSLFQTIEFSWVFAPFILAALIALSRQEKPYRSQVNLIVMIIALVGVTWLFRPVMGYQYRFLFPAVIPILLLGQPSFTWLVSTGNEIRDQNFSTIFNSVWSMRKVVPILFLILVPLASLKGMAYYNHSYPSGLQSAHISLAYWLNDNAQSDSSVAIGDIGAVGYYCNLKILDLNGLVEPAVLEGGYNVSYIYSRHPDFLVISSISDQYMIPAASIYYPLVEHASFTNYSFVKVFTFSHSVHLWLYRI